MARNVPSRFTFDSGEDINPVWSSDGSRYRVCRSTRGCLGIYVKDSNLAGGEQLLYKQATFRDAIQLVA
jgi:Tol biopolymer transport system component